MYNLGFQNTAFAREAKTTRPGQSGSLSTLYLVETAPGVYSGKLRVCRVGDTFYFHHQMSGEKGWTEEAYGGNTVPMGNGAGEATPGVTAGGAIRFQRADMPAAVQLGMLAGNWGAPLEARGGFGFLCLAAGWWPGGCSGPFRGSWRAGPGVHRRPLAPPD